MIHVTMHGTIPRAISEADIQRTVREIFRAARRAPNGSVDVAFVTDRKIAQLNAQYRGYRRPTDVLSFEGEGDAWGDILIAPTYARAEAKRRSVPVAEELLRLVAHGTLHLLGYDHATPTEEKRMFGIQERVLQRVNG